MAIKNAEHARKAQEKELARRAERDRLRREARRLEELARKHESEYKKLFDLAPRLKDKKYQDAAWFRNEYNDDTSALARAWEDEKYNLRQLIAIMWAYGMNTKPKVHFR